MDSLNNQYIQQSLADKTVARYRRTPSVRGAVSGFRLEPETNLEVQFIVCEGDYEQEVIELYSDKEKQYFLRKNKEYIESGLLVPYTEEKPEVSLNNHLTDQQLMDMFNLPFAEFKNKVNPLSSYHIQRLATLAEDSNRTKQVKQFLNGLLKS